MKKSIESSTNFYSLCEKIAHSISLSDKNHASCKKIVPILKKSRSNTIELFKKIASFDRNENGLSDAVSWLADNFSFVDEDFKGCIYALSKAKGKLTNNSVPFCYEVAFGCADFCECAFNEDTVKAIVKSCDERIEKGMSTEDFSSFSVLLKSAVLCHIGNVCKSIKENGAFTDARSDGIILINAIKSIKFLSTYSFDDAFAACKLENILCADPSGAYPLMTAKSKAELKKNIHISAQKSKMHDYDYANLLLEKAKNEEFPGAKYIGNNEYREVFLSKLYFPVLYLLSFILAATASIVILPILFPILFFPIFEAVKLLTDFVFSKISKKSAAIPQIDISDIPNDSKTLCVITALLSGNEHDKILFDRIERIRNANHSKNIRFGLLCDLPDCDSATSAADGNILSYAMGRIDSLNAKHKDEFILFIRPRSYSKSERKFMAYERKRGAVIELARLIKTKKSTFDTSSAGFQQNLDFIFDTKFIITLDADTNLGLDGAKKLVGKIIHPANRAVVDKNSRKIVSGYGILQPKMSTDLDSACATPFTRLLCGNGGADIYSSACFDIYQSLFGNGIFCGKGIIDVSAFYETVCHEKYFPDDTILSHDILEGERASTALLCDVELTDGFPKNELSYLKRKHRWIRGDIQNICFLKKSFCGHKNDFSALSKYKLFDNVRRIFTPIFSFALIPISFVLDSSFSPILFFIAFSPCIIPFLLEIYNLTEKLAFVSAARRFFSKGITVGIWQSFLRMLFFGCMLAKDAFLSLGATALSIYRMLFSKKKLLQWVTAAQSEGEKLGLFIFIKKHFVSFVCGALILVFADGGLIKFSGLAFILMPFLGYITAKDRLKINKTKVSEKERKIIKSYAFDIWKFFKENVNASEHHLPPDNIQLSPYEKTDHRTSPTNIGLYLLSVLAARDFSFIDTNELYERVENTISTIEKLPKWHGNLYNWYDTKNLSVLFPKYISSVDSGNFVASLVAVSSGLAEYTNEKTEIIDLLGRINAIISTTNLLPLYNEKRNLFRVGVTICDDKVIYDSGCYDFLMSESRILSYLCCSNRIVPPQHWKCLSRPMVSQNGYIGIASWSGTAFEFFMPALFMPIKKSSLMYEAMLFAYKEQTKRKAHGVWGISESGFFAFDCDMNYQYRAFGVPTLGLDGDLAESLVISPYSSFLSMCVSTSGALSNLAAIEKLKAYGKYGFYEAIDFTRSRVKKGFVCVKSYMSHHLGMSLIALSNAYFDNNFVARFMMDRKMQAGYELLEEKIPVNALIKKVRNSKNPHTHFERCTSYDSVFVEKPSFENPSCACISDGKLSLSISETGHIEAKRGDTLLFLSSFEKYPDCIIDSLYCYILIDGRIYGMSPLCDGICNDSDFSFSYSEKSITQRLSCEKGVFSLSHTISPGNISVLKVSLSGKTKAQNGQFRFVFSPCLTSKKAYLSHPSFSDLFIDSEFDEKENILYYRRRKRTVSDENSVLAVALSEKQKSMVFSTRRNYGNYTKYDYFSDINDKKSGACINPFCIIGAEFEEDFKSELLMCFAHSFESAKKAIEEARTKSFEKSEKELLECATDFNIAAGISPLSPDGCVRHMLSHLAFGNNEKNDIQDHTDITLDKLWKHGISGDEKIAVIDTGKYFFRSALEKRIRAYKLCAFKNQNFDLVILYSESDRYEKRLEKRLKKLIFDCNAGGFLERKSAGIKLIEKQSAEKEINAIIFSAAYVEKLYEKQEAQNGNTDGFLCDIINMGKNTKNTFPDGFSVVGGEFLCDGFLIDKFSKNPPQAPFAHILSGENISSVLTCDSLGYTFVKNASECRITPTQTFSNRNCEGEKLYYKENRVLFDLIKCAQYVKFSCGAAQYFGKVSSLEYQIHVFCDKTLAVKYIKITFFGNIPKGAAVFFNANPCMGNKAMQNKFSKAQNTVFFSNPLSTSMRDLTGFVTVFSNGKTEAVCDKGHFLYNSQKSEKNCDFASLSSEIFDKNPIVFAIGVARNNNVFSHISKAVSEIERRREIAEEFCQSLIPKINFVNTRKSDLGECFEKMFNLYLPYDTVFSRMLARAGYYQSGGAYGFRDQLQDCLCILYGDKKRAQSHIFRAASHQFVEGDVLHWWHEQTRSGVRTKCSDDYLWLVYACTEYFKLTGKYDFLNTTLPYISAEPLDERCVERYSSYRKSGITENLYMHNARALDRAVQLCGKHGLCLMGSCDWCDGYSAVGKDMVGESTFTSMFLVMLLENFLPICAIFSDTERAQRYEKEAQRLKKAIELHCFDKESGYFIRGFYDNGERLGAPECDEGKIDLLAQSFCVLARLDENMCKSAVKKARQMLFDEELKITRLVSPAFDKTEKEPGYIKGYLPGVRENGGQYTHGAMFYALACFELSEKTRHTDAKFSAECEKFAKDVITYSNPAVRASNLMGEMAFCYKTEPYSVAADIYSNQNHSGRGGWTHYTGACGWLYRLMLKYVFGLEFFDVDTEKGYILITPQRACAFSKTLVGTALKIKEFGFDLKIEYLSGKESCVFADKKEAKDRKITKDTRNVQMYL